VISTSRKWFCLVCTVGSLACAAELAAQTRSAMLEGTVRDATGGVLPGATVAVKDSGTNQTRAVIADGQGFFRVAELPVGTYDVRVEFPGFTLHQHPPLTLAIGQTVHLDIALSPSGVVETVGVSAAPPPLDARQTAVTMTVDTERVEELPVRSRNYLEFVLLAPGVSPAPPGGRPGAASGLPDSGFSFGGLRPRSNMLSIDGLDNNDEFSGAGRTELSLEIVREFQVVTNGWTAENGGGAGGAINVVTKSGANVIHGDAFVFLQSGRLNARPKLEETAGIKPTLHRYRAGLAVGGPLIKDRTFYYVAGEQEETRDRSASDISPRAIATINQTLAAGFLPGLATRRLTTGLFPTGRSETELSGKITHQASARNSLVGRIATTNNRESGDAFNTGGLSDASARGSTGTRDVAFTSTWTAILGSSATNDVRGQAAARRVDSRTTDAQGPGVVISGVAEFGRPYFGNAHHDQRYAETGDTFAVTKGSHFVKAGGDLMRVGIKGRSADGFGGLYLFRSLDAFMNGQPDSFREAFGNPDGDIAITRAGAFVQDHWSPRAAVTIDLGIRFDAEQLPARLNITDRQVSPRLGVAWTPAPRWVVRGGAGRFADRLPAAAFERALALDGRIGFEKIGDAARSIYTVRPGAWHPSSSQFSAGVERQLATDLTASANYLLVRGRNLARTVNVAWPAGAGQDDFELQPTASSKYVGVTATLNRRLSHEIEWDASYTWSHAKDSASDFDEQPANPRDLASGWSDARYDERHRFVASALFDLPIGDEEDRKPGDPPPSGLIRAFSNIELAPIITVGSGHPLNPLTGADDLATHSWPLTARPPGLARNSLRLPRSATVDLRVLKFFSIKPHGKLDLVVEAFNLLNRPNITELNTVYGSGPDPLRSFGRSIEAAAPRHLQFSIDFEF
jgi:hypothetical protein